METIQFYVVLAAILFFTVLIDAVFRLRIKSRIKRMEESLNAQIKGVWNGYNGLARRCDKIDKKLLGEPLYKAKTQYGDITVIEVGTMQSTSPEDTSFYHTYLIFDSKNICYDRVKEEVITRRLKMFNEEKAKKKSAVKKAVAKVSKRK